MNELPFHADRELRLSGDESLRGRYFRTSIFFAFVLLAAVYNFSAQISGTAKLNRGDNLGYAISWLVEAEVVSRFIFDRFYELQEIKNEVGNKEIADRLLELDLTIPDDLNSRTSSDPVIERDPPELIRLIKGEILTLDVMRVTVANGNFVLCYFFTIYTWIFLSKPGNEARRKWGDSIYFFGFILTLISLIYALSHSGRFAGVNLSTIVVQNAIALSSTVFGLFLRQLVVLPVPVTENSEDPSGLDELEMQIESARNEFEKLGNSVQDFRNTVLDLQQSISGSGIVFNDQVEEIVRELRDKAHEISEVKIDKELIADQMAQAARLALASIDDEIANLTDAIRLGREDLSQRTAIIGNEFQIFAETVKRGSNLGKDAFETLIQGILAQAEDTDVAFSTIGSSIQKGSDDLRARMGHLSTSLSEGGDEAREALHKLGIDFSSEGGSTTRALAEVGAQLKASGGNVEEAISDFNETLRRSAKQSENALEDFAAGIEGSSASISSGVRTLSDRIGSEAYEEFRDRLSSTIDSITMAIENETEKMKISIGNLESEFSAAGNSFRNAGEDVRSIIPSITKYSDALIRNEKLIDKLSESLGILDNSLLATVLKPDWLQSHGEKILELSSNMSELKDSLENLASRLEKAASRSSKNSSPANSGGNRSNNGFARFFRWGSK